MLRMLPSEAVRPAAQGTMMAKLRGLILGIISSNLIILIHKQSSAYGSLRRLLIIPLRELISASIGLPFMEPEVSRRKYTGSLPIIEGLTI
jgi:hypothetical protein